MSCLFDGDDGQLQTTAGLVLVVRDAVCGVSGHRDGMWHLALLFSSTPALRVVATAGRRHHAAYLASRGSLHRTRGGSLSSAFCAWPLGVRIAPRSWHHFQPYSHGLGQPSQLQTRHTWFSHDVLALVHAQKPTSWHLLAHASLLACSLCARDTPRMRCECTCSHRRLGAGSCNHELGVSQYVALESVDTMKAHHSGV